MESLFGSYKEWWFSLLCSGSFFLKILFSERVKDIFTTFRVDYSPLCLFSYPFPPLFLLLPTFLHAFSISVSLCFSVPFPFCHWVFVFLLGLFKDWEPYKGVL